MHRGKFRFLLGFACASAAIVSVSPSYAEDVATISFDIPAQPLPDAINSYSRQAKLQIFFPSEQIARLRSVALKGNFTPDDALRRLIAGSGLEVARKANGTIMLRLVRQGNDGVIATADEVPADETQTVVVTGIRASLADSREVKRKADIFKDSIVAEDIAKFPDLNLAESLQRLPGVAIVREAGEGRRINLRGLGSDFTRVKLNDMEVLGNVDSANDSRGQATRDRAFDFNLFASELFTRVDVEKSATARQDEGGLAGTVSLYTAKPFDFRGFHAAASFQGGTNNKTRDFDQRYVGLISNTWGDRFGVTVSAAYTRRHTEEQGYDTYRWIRASPDAFGPGGPDISSLPAATQDLLRSGKVFFARGNRYSNWESDQKRLGLTGSVQWRPTDTLEFTADGLYGHFSSDRHEYHIHTRGTVAGESALTDDSDYYTRNGVRIPLGPSKINAIEVNSNNEAVYMDVSNTNLGTESRLQHTVNKFRQGALAGKWNPTDRVEVTALIGKETSDYSIPVGDKLYTEAYGGIVTDYRGDNKFYGKNTYDFDTTNPANFRADSFEFREDFQSSKLSTIKVDAKYALFDKDALRVGYERRFFQNAGYGHELDAYLASEFQNGVLNDDLSKIAKVYRNHDKLPWIAVDVPEAEAFYKVDREAVIPRDRLDDWAVKERTQAAYAQYDFDHPLGGMRLRGNAGVRWYRTTQTSFGQINDQPGSVSSSYDGFLPSANATLSVTSNFLVRAAYAKNINRVGLDSVRLSASVEKTGGDITVAAGNPNLKPYKADNIDIGAEYYFGKVGAISAAYFHKRIKGFPGSDTAFNVPFSATGLPLNSLPGVTLTPDTIVAQFTRPVNLRDFNLSGVELNVQSDLFFLPAPFDKLGIAANATIVSSTVDYATAAQSAAGVHYYAPLLGLSHKSGNLSIYYETGSWGARLSANYRGGWLDRGNPSFRYGDVEDDSDGWEPTTYVDVTAHVALNKNVRLTFDGINITGEREVQWVNSDKRLHNTLASGSTFLAGVSVKF